MQPLLNHHHLQHPGTKPLDLEDMSKHHDIWQTMSRNNQQQQKKKKKKKIIEFHTQTQH